MGLDLRQESKNDFSLPAMQNKKMPPEKGHQASSLITVDIIVGEPKCIAVKSLKWG